MATLRGSTGSAWPSLAGDSGAVNPSPYSAAALRHAAVHFLTGRVASAVLTLAILLVLVRVLELGQYGYYVTLVALAEVTWQVCDFGLPWAAARYLPEMRLHADGRQLVRRIWQLLAWLTLCLATVALLAYPLLPALLEHFGLKQARDAAAVYLLVVVVEGCGRHARESVLGPLMQQAAVRASIIIRHASFLAGVGALAWHGEVRLIDVVITEVGASVPGTCAALLSVHRHGRAFVIQEGRAGWAPPDMRVLWRTGLPMYGAQLASITYSPQVMTVLMQRVLGAEAAALFGFLRSLHAYAGRYLPAELLFGLIRPRLVASFVSGGGMPALSAQAQLVGKVSLLALMPMLAFAAVFGDVLVGALSAGRFVNTGWLLAGMLLALVPFSQRRLLETVAVTIGHGGLCAKASAAGALGLPLAIVLVVLGAGVWSAVVGVLFGQMLFALVVLLALRAKGFRPATASAHKLFVVAVATTAGAWILTLTGMPVGATLFAGALVVLAISFVVTWIVEPFSIAERDMFNRLAGRRVFRQ